MKTSVPTYTPKSKAEAERVANWLIACKLPLSWTGTPPTFSIGYEKRPLAHLQMATDAFDLLRQVCEAGGCDAQLLSRINLLLKAVNEK